MINKKNIKIINSLYFSGSPNKVRQALLCWKKSYLPLGIKRTFHSKVALTIENLTPKIFIKKINLDKTKTIPLKTPNSLGYVRHFPAATKEWSSSIYAHYNNNHIKSLPVLDKNLVKLIKSYFNFYHQSEKLKYAKRQLIRFRRVLLNKVFVSKAELEHSNSKVIINIHVYNLQKRLLMQEISLIVDYLNELDNSLMVDYLEKLELENSFKVDFFEKWKKKIFLLDFLEKLELENSLKVDFFEKWEKSLIVDYLEKWEEKWEKRCSDFLLAKSLLIKHYGNLLELYENAKFKLYIPKLIQIIAKIYKKKVEINIVILKHMYLNSDILSQAIALKLRDRDNRVWRVLRSCLGMVRVPYTNRFKERTKANRVESLVDKIKNLDLDSLTSLVKQAKGPLPASALYKAYFQPYFVGKSSFIKGANLCQQSKAQNDSLNQLLFGILPILPEGKHAGWNFFVKNCLKYKAIGGVRLEAKGRLTRRFTASRSVFKLTWKGGLKNIDSSYKGLSAAILRGHVKSNVQYTLISDKNRIGAYGVKGWVSGK